MTKLASIELCYQGATLLTSRLKQKQMQKVLGRTQAWCIAVVKTGNTQQRETLSLKSSFPCKARHARLCEAGNNEQTPHQILLFLFLIKDFSFVFFSCLFVHILRHHAQKISFTKGIMLTLYQKNKQTKKTNCMFSHLKICC